MLPNKIKSLKKLIPLSIRASFKQSNLTMKFAQGVLEKSTEKPDIIICREALSSHACIALNKKYPDIVNIMDACEIPELDGRISSNIRKLFKPLKKLFTKWELEYSRDCSKFFTVCNSFKDILEERYGHEVKLLRNIKKPITERGNKKLLSEKFGFGEEDIVLVCPGQPDPASGVLEAIDAITYLPDNFKLLIIGSDSNKPFMKQVFSKIEKLALQDRIKYQPAIYSEKYHEIISSCDLSIILLDTSILQAKLVLPNRFFDTIASKIPVFSSDNTEISKIISEYNNGKICSTHSPKEIAEEISSMFESGKMKEAYTKNLEKVANHFEQERLKEWENFRNIMSNYLNEGKKNVSLVARANVSCNLRTINLCNSLSELGFNVSLYSTKKPLNKDLLAHPEKIKTITIDV